MQNSQNEKRKILKMKNRQIYITPIKLGLRYNITNFYSLVVINEHHILKSCSSDDFTDAY